MRPYKSLLFLAACISISACEKVVYDPNADAQGHTAPTAATIEANKGVLNMLPFADRQDFEDAERGLIARLPSLRIENDSGNMVWDQSVYDFIKGEAPASVNPSLWRQATLNNIHGLFKVTEGVYQLRGFDLANITLIESNSGWIVVDPATADETARAAWEFALQHLDDKPIVAVIFTHSHVDHFGGVQGLLRDADAKEVKVVAPLGFMEEATSENVIAGSTMSRRAAYMYGQQLAKSERGHVDSGLGKAPAYGTVSIMQPTEIIQHTPQPMRIDGVDFIFQYVPDSEAPAELTFYLPQLKAFCGAELLSRNMHNLYTLRGAKVRDALKWSNYIDEALTLFPDTEVYFASHHWPMWGKSRVNEFLRQHRDTYKYIHDQTLRLAAMGHTPIEIAEELELPESLSRDFSNRGYYGTVRHNARAVYQAYFGWYDGNPANLNPIPPVDAARRYVKLMGGADTVLARAREFFEQGEYRWVAELLNHLVFADPSNTQAKALLASNYDQLGYQAESGPWRDVYLSAAYELRHGMPNEAGIELGQAVGLLMETPLPRFFDAMAVAINGPKADGVELRIKLEFTDIEEIYLLDVENAVLHHRPGEDTDEANATIQLTHSFFIRLLIGETDIAETLMSDEIQVIGSRIDLLRFFSLLEAVPKSFEIVTP